MLSKHATFTVGPLHAFPNTLSCTQTQNTKGGMLHCQSYIESYKRNRFPQVNLLSAAFRLIASTDGICERTKRNSAAMHSMVISLLLRDCNILYLNLDADINVDNSIMEPLRKD